ncbi:MAG: hypothetical protein WBH68_05785 [Erysipelotrichaceae bacterium]|jgi:hypothetical protein|nr:hypothetical protein [Bacillota bacterium]NLP22295.1 hypothetical protein [Erysipelotrichaceae bacterium]HCY06383.1 hypothetical protein [Erysipelotrichaceae bacterium]
MGTNNKKGKKPFDTKLMQEKLKGDTFPDDWDDFLDDNIRIFFDELLEKTGLKKSEIIRKANLSRVYGYQLMEGRRRGKRDYYILLALAMSLDLKTTQRMLAIAQYGALHPLIKRDAAIIFAINHKYDIIKAYEFMCSLGLQPLDDGTEN